MCITRGSTLTSDWLYSLHPKWGNSILSAKTIPGPDCGPNNTYESLLQNSDLNKVGKTTRPSRCDLNQIPYDYTVEVTSKFNRLDLRDRVPEELWTEVRNIVQESMIKTIPKKRNTKKSRWLSEEALQIAKRREEKQKSKEKMKDISFWMKSSKE